NWSPRSASRRDLRYSAPARHSGAKTATAARCAGWPRSSARACRGWRSSRCRTANATHTRSGAGPTTSWIAPRTPTMQTLHATSPDDHAAALAAHPRLLVDYHKDDCAGCRMLDMSLRKFAGTPAAAGVVLLRVKLETV